MTVIRNTMNKTQIKILIPVTAESASFAFESAALILVLGDGAIKSSAEIIPIKIRGNHATPHNIGPKGTTQ